MFLKELDADENIEKDQHLHTIKQMPVKTGLDVSWDRILNAALKT